MDRIHHQCRRRRRLVHHHAVDGDGKVVLTEMVAVDNVVAVACLVVENGQDLELQIVSQGMELDRDQLDRDLAGHKGQTGPLAVEDSVADNNLLVALLHIEGAFVSGQTTFPGALEDFSLANLPSADCQFLPGPNLGCQSGEESIAMIEIGLENLVARARSGLVVGLVAGPVLGCLVEYGGFALGLDLHDSAPLEIKLNPTNLICDH